ncbi:NAD-dependent epimerase/dehydratase family protein, partial [Oceanibaculum nanhaiense]|uniref:NAD-dependent epimerase/dehydratase family protein n=1 Tax=Oceanibaculum nanhaiense TaxID=1909734 RepID=UPI00396E8F1C
MPGPDARIYVAGHTGLAGSTIRRRLEAEGHRNLLLRTHTELELTDEGAVERFFAAERPSHVILAAAKVGGIAANAAFPAEFLS